MRYYINYKVMCGGAIDAKKPKPDVNFISLLTGLTKKEKLIIVVLYIQLLCEYDFLITLSGLQRNTILNINYFDFYNDINPYLGFHNCFDMYSNLISKFISSEFNKLKELITCYSRDMLKKNYHKDIRINENAFNSLWDSRNYSIYILQSVLKNRFKVNPNQLILFYINDILDNFEIPDILSQTTIINTLNKVKITGHLFLLNYMKKVEFISIQASLEHYFLALLPIKKVNYSITQVIFDAIVNYIKTNYRCFTHKGQPKIVYAYAWRKVSEILKKYYKFKVLNNEIKVNYIISNEDREIEEHIECSDNNNLICDILNYDYRSDIPGMYKLTYNTDIFNS